MPGRGHHMGGQLPADAHFAPLIDDAETFSKTAIVENAG
jgi:hypothetical protein